MEAENKFFIQEYVFPNGQLLENKVAELKAALGLVKRLQKEVADITVNFTVNTLREDSSIQALG